MLLASQLHIFLFARLVVLLILLAILLRSTAISLIVATLSQLTLKKNSKFR